MENVNEHDMTKKMMEVIRGGHKSKLITEANEHEQDTIIPKPGDAVYNEELKKLQDIVDKGVEITNFKIYPMDKNVIIEGNFQRGEDEGSGIFFKMEIKKHDVETSMKNVDLNDEIAEKLNHLKGHYKNFSAEWLEKLSREYKPEQR